MPYQRNIRELLDAHRDYLLSKVSKVRILGEVDERELKDVFVELSIVEQRLPQQQSEFLGMMDSALRRRFNPFADGDTDTNPDGPLKISGHKRPNRVRPDELLRRRTKAIVTGAPGCGKTTLLKYLALQALEKEKRLAVWLELKAIDKPLFAQAERAAAHDGYLILQELWLKHLKAQLSLSTLETSIFRQHWQEKFKANDLAVLLDGFDELQDEAAERSLNKCVREFASALHDNTLLISTRPYAQHRLGKERLQELEIEPLNQRQIGAFLNCYYPNDPETKSLLETLRERSSLRELLHVPLLLGVILRLRRENRFTDERLKLYETITADLVHELDRSKSVNRQFKIENERLRWDFLRFLAFERLLRDQLEEEEEEANRIVFSYDLLKVKAGTFLAQERSSHNPRDLADDALATPLLREVGADSFAFTHLTLQEYLAARAFAAFHKSNEFEGFKIFCRAYHNPTIVEMEVLPMILGALTNADKLYAEIECWSESLTFANLRLRARGLAYSARIKQERIARLVDHLLECLTEHSGEDPYQEIVISSFVGIKRPTIGLIETKAALSRTTNIRVTEALGRIGSDKAVHALTSSLDDREWWHRSDAVKALGRIGSDKAVEALIHAIGDESGYVRASVASALGRIGSDKAVDALIPALNEEDSSTRLRAASSLAEIGSEKAVDALISALNDEADDVRSYAAGALGRISSDKVVDVLISTLNDTNNDVRWSAANALREIGSEKAVNALISTLNDTNYDVHWNTDNALRQIGPEKSVAALISALNNKDLDMCWKAADELGRLGSDKGVGALISALEHSDSSVRLRAASVLGEIGSDIAVDALISALGDEAVYVRLGAADALGRIGSEKAVDALIPALNVEDTWVDYLSGVSSMRLRAASALGEIGSETAVDALITAVNDKNIDLRLTAVSALGRIASDKAVGSLISALRDELPDVRSKAAEALTGIRVETLIPGLARTLKHNDAFARKKAIVAIGYYSEDRQTLDRLRQLAHTDEDSDTREAAEEASEKFERKLELLGHFGAEGTAQPLSANESRELFLVGEAFKVTAEAGHIFRPTANSDWGIDGEIEFKNDAGQASGERIYLQLKSGDSYLRKRKRDGREIFTIKNLRHAEYWQAHRYPVLLVIHDSGGRIRWMNVTEYLQRHGPGIKQIEFQGEPFTAESVKRMRIRFAR